MLEATGLRKQYGDLVAVDGVSLSVAQGEIVGLLGPNGAGKTTTIAMLAGLVAPDAGTVRVGGRALGPDADPAKRAIGLVPQELALYEELPALENLRIFGGLYDLARAGLARSIEAALTLVGLADRAKDKVKTYSGGMKRRLNLAAGILHDPSLLLLDEPTVGVDPQSRNAIFDNIEELKRRGKSVVYTTHYMEEAERLCDRVVIMDHGRVLASDTVRGLSRLASKGCTLVIELSDTERPPDLEELQRVTGAEKVQRDGATLRLEVSDLGEAAATALRALTKRGHTVAHVQAERADLETVFLHLTGRKLRDA